MDKDEDILLACPWQPALNPCKLDAKRSCISTIWGEIKFTPPKIIVALSLTSTYVREFPKDAVVFPAIVDTGFNRTLEIDYRQLSVDQIRASWSALAFAHQSVRDNQGKQRPYCYCTGGIWLHRYPFGYKKRLGEKLIPPILLGRSTSIRVVMTDESTLPKPEPWPPLPLLGLEAFLVNNLTLSIDSQKKLFSLHQKHPKR